MVRNFFCFYFLFFICSPAFADVLTPQKYCESLPASSCEVLNVDFPASLATYRREYTNNQNGSFGYALEAPLGVIKYCRNRVFRAHVMPARVNIGGDEPDFTYRVGVGTHSSDKFKLDTEPSDGSYANIDNNYLCQKLP